MPFVKGDPNINREGRPKGFSIVAHLKEKLQEIPEGQKESYASLITKKYMDKALIEGDVAILKDLIDRVDGKSLQALDLSHSGAIEFIIKKPDETN